MAEDWRNNKTLMEKLDDIKKKGMFADFTVKLEYEENSSIKTKIYKLHSLLLILASVVFEKLFENNFSEEEQKVLTLNYSPDHFDIFINFVYQGAAKFVNIYDAWGVYKISHYYFVEPLKELCLDYIGKNIDPTNAAFCLENAKLYNLKEFKKNARKCIMDNLGEADLTYLSKEDIEEILDERAICIKEVHLFKKIESWITEKLNDLMDLSKREEMKKILCDAFIPKFHFFEMTNKEFADGPGKSELLTVEQKFSIYQNMTSFSLETLADRITHFKHRRILKSICPCSPKKSLCAPSSDGTISIEFLNESSFMTLSSDIALNTSNGNSFSFFFIAKTYGRILQVYSIAIDVEESSGKIKIEFDHELFGKSVIKFEKNVIDGMPHFLSVEFFESKISATLDDGLPIARSFLEDPEMDFMLFGKSFSKDRSFTGILSHLYISHTGPVDFHKDHDGYLNVVECDLMKRYKYLYPQSTIQNTSD